MSQYEFGPLRVSELDVIMANIQQSIGKPKAKTTLRSSRPKLRRKAKREARHAS